MNRIKFGLFLLCLGIAACSGSDVKEAADLIDGVPRKTIDTSIMGVNAFASDARFGSPAAQFNEVKNTLRLNYVRVLFAWTDAVQPSPSAAADFSFYDSLIESVPSGVDVLIVTSALPSWMSNASNWVDNNPRRTLAERWLSPLIKRYASRRKVVGFEIWNEPNQPNADNVVLGLNNSAENYVELLALAFNIARENAPSKLVVSAATTAINQNFPESLDYNRAMRDAGAGAFADIWGVHYYGKQFENVIRPDGVRDFLNSLGKPIWLTESGEQGVNNQLAYVEQVWPFLTEKISSIQRIYYYQHTESTAASESYGLRTLDSSTPLSDLYVYLRDR